MQIKTLAKKLRVKQEEVIAACKELGYREDKPTSFLVTGKEEAVRERLTKPSKPSKPANLPTETGPVTPGRIMELSRSVNEPSDPGFEDLYNNISALINMYPEREQFQLALRAREDGNENIAYQALRNGLVDLR